MQVQILLRVFNLIGGKLELYIGGKFDGAILETPIESNEIELRSGDGNDAETYTRRRIGMPPVYKELFAVETMSDTEIFHYLRSANISVV